MNKRFVTLLSICSVLGISGTLAAPEGRIVGGDDAVLGQIPYQASINVAGAYNCGAVILTEQYALTALICVSYTGTDRPWPANLFGVTAGTINLYSGGQEIKVEEIIINPNYNELETGIALLKLRSPLVFNGNVRGIPLALKTPPVGAQVEISGWGRIKQTDANMYQWLQFNYATVISDDECQHLINNDNDQILCLSHPRKNGICQGDRGSPAVYHGELVALANIADECGSLLPDSFTNIVGYRDWILEQISN